MAGHGKKSNQKLKPYVVLQYLMKNTDENHLATAYDIIAFWKMTVESKQNVALSIKILMISIKWH